MFSQTEQTKILLDLIQLEREIRDIQTSGSLSIIELDLLTTKRKQLYSKTNIELIVGSILDLEEKDLLSLNIEEWQ